MATVTPLWGSEGVSGDAVCSLLEVNDDRILLDCGLSSHLSKSDLKKRLLALKGADGRGLDAVIISHADVQHMGALPLLFKLLGPVQVICTLPILKMGQMVLYDLYLNRAMEGHERSANGEEEGDGGELFTLDDVDGALEDTITVRYNQTVPVPNAARGQAGTHTLLCGFPAGRTIGGTVWSFKYAAGEIVYAMDVSLSKSMVLNALPLNKIPLSPSVLLMEGSHSQSSSNGLKGNKPAAFDAKELVQEVMRTLRNEGNVLIPCESAAKTLDIIKVLGDEWERNNLGVYHLVFLSHMAYNVLEFARSQLEWMSDDMSAAFYNNNQKKRNPLYFSLLKTAYSVSQLDAMRGPKVVLATDSSLDCGLSKELLLRWGGDPKSKVIFTDSLKSQTSLASEIRSQLSRQPLIVTVHRPERVKLEGAELEAFKQRKEEARQRVQEEAQILRRERELAQLVAGRRVEEDEDEEEEDEDGIENVENGDLTEVDGDEAAKENAPLFQPGRINRFAKVTFPLFEAQRRPADDDDPDYGMSIADLFPEPNRPVDLDTGAAGLMQNAITAGGGLGAGDSDEEDEKEPVKIVARKTRVQFACSFVELEGGRAPVSSLRTLLSSMRPQRVLFMRHSKGGTELLQHASSMNIDQESRFLAADGSAVHFPLVVKSLRLKVPADFFTKEMQTVSNTKRASTCQVAALGTFSRVGAFDCGADGVYSVSLVAEASEEERVAAVVEEGGGGKEGGMEMDVDGEAGACDGGNDMDVVQDGEISGEEDQAVDEDEAEDAAVRAALQTALLAGRDAPAGMQIGAVSVGEVTLESLRDRLQELGVEVATEIEDVIPFLLCSGEVRITKDRSSANGFNVEGPPSPTLYLVRKALYDLYAFI